MGVFEQERKSLLSCKNHHSPLAKSTFTLICSDSGDIMLSF